MDRRGETMNNSWNKVIYKMWSPVYDYIFNSGSFLTIRKQILQDVPLSNQHKALFVGVGTGADLELIDHKHLDITAIDLSLRMLNKAKQKFQNSLVKFFEMDAQNMNFNSEEFDFVFAHLILSVVPNPEQCFQEMKRVLKPGGKIIIFDKFAPRDNRLSPIKRLLRPAISFLGTDIGVSFEEIFKNNRENLVMEEDVPVMFNGMYRKIVIRKL